jgi:UDP-N-acetyl-D-galactosamine dehydrogenase
MKSFRSPLPNSTKVAVVGLGYVGLPLAFALSKKYNVLGFDISSQRIAELNAGLDTTKEFSKKEVADSKIHFTNSNYDLKTAEIYIIAVPTPVNQELIPDLGMLISASEDVGKFLTNGNIVVYESTVYPGATEEECLPVLEKASGLKINQDFFLGYSPERINPSDTVHKINNITKVVSGSNEYSLKVINELYTSIIDAGTYMVNSIKVAEAAKVIENTQRDLNIALINEFSKIFSHLGLDTEEVLKAAETKWNFIPFRPGLVGGHCIGVDPYYLTYKAQQVGYDPQVILSGRVVNDHMPYFIADSLLNKLNNLSFDVANSHILVLGYTFKENCNDIRNTKVHDLALTLSNRVNMVNVFDPLINNEQANSLTEINFIDYPEVNKYDAIIIAVGHQAFLELGIKKIREFCKQDGLIYDLKYLFPPESVDLRL